MFTKMSPSVGKYRTLFEELEDETISFYKCSRMPHKINFMFNSKIVNSKIKIIFNSKILHLEKQLGLRKHCSLICLQ